MRIPKVLKNGGHKITVVKLSEIDINQPGDYRPYHQRIHLRRSKDTPESAVSEAFLHEIFECIVSQNNLVIDHTHLTVLSEKLFEIIRRNNLDFADLESY